MESEPAVIVWARKAAIARSCPRSSISADSLTWLEEYHVWRMTGKSGLLEMPSRKAEAFLALESEWMKEKQDGEQ
jgi:hypothetical protein